MIRGTRASDGDRTPSEARRPPKQVYQMMSIYEYSIRRVLPAIAAICAMIAFTACDDSDDGGGGASENTVQFDPALTVNPDSDGYLVLQFSGREGTAWTAHIETGAEWVSFNRFEAQPDAAGTIGTTIAQNEVAVYYTANGTASDRYASLTVTFDGEEPVLLEMAQYSTSQNVYPAGNNWPELPAEVVNSNFIYVTHYCPVKNALSGKSFTGRNYTMCFDKTKRGAWWVAYPMASAYLGSGRPNDPWAYDPKIPSAYQANLSAGGYGTGYDRGHQCPNADRNADPYGTMCYQTFYCSNATPQVSSLNQKSWATLEADVRGWVCSDTTYVVTGAWWGDAPKTVTDKSGDPCPIPDAYFKVICRTVKGNIRTAGDQLGDFDAGQLKSIGFWVTNSSANAADNPKQWVKSVADIERLTGFTFFPTIPAAVKQQTETASWGL